MNGRRGFIARLACVAAVASAIALAGCAHMPWAKEFDPASGNWDGHWYVKGRETPAGELKCAIEKTAKDEWKAVFDAKFGGSASYEVELAGHREGEAVVFAGVVPLGQASGGDFTWKGRIEGDEFNGDYTSQFINGSFKMKRAETEPVD